MNLWALHRYTLCAAIGFCPLLDTVAAADKINASYGAISGSMAPIWVAKEGRLFDKSTSWKPAAFSMR
ncbi:MAG: hypothetical protein FJ145_16185 [Deltaproteobacteria bacterium]|nr:hypothetical protein [Deltaproteobacteria bacterium]